MQIQIHRNWKGNKSFIQTIYLKGKYAIEKKEFVLIVLQLLLTWDENMHQEKKKMYYGKFFDFRAQKCI